MGFAYGLEGFRFFQSVFSRPASILYSLNFEVDRDFEIAWILKCTEPAIRLWFSMVGGFLDRPVFQHPGVFTSSLFFNGWFGGVLTGSLKLHGFAGAPNPRFSYGLPWSAFFSIGLFFQNDRRLK